MSFGYNVYHSPISLTNTISVKEIGVHKRRVYTVSTKRNDTFIEMTIVIYDLHTLIIQKGVKVLQEYFVAIREEIIYLVVRLQL